MKRIRRKRGPTGKIECQSKRCSICKRNLPLSQFANWKNSADGRAYRCRRCARMYYKANREAYRRRSNLHYRAHAEKYIELNAAYARAHPDRSRARARAGRARRSGALKPGPCEDCGALSTKTVAHHSDYNKPLDVTWLCTRCHWQRHYGAPVAKDKRGALKTA